MAVVVVLVVTTVVVGSWGDGTACVGNCTTGGSGTAGIYGGCDGDRL